MQLRQRGRQRHVAAPCARTPSVLASNSRPSRAHLLVGRTWGRPEGAFLAAEARTHWRFQRQQHRFRSRCWTFLGRLDLGIPGPDWAPRIQNLPRREPARPVSGPSQPVAARHRIRRSPQRQRPTPAGAVQFRRVALWILSLYSYPGMIIHRNVNVKGRYRSFLDRAPSGLSVPSAGHGTAVLTPELRSPGQ